MRPGHRHSAIFQALSDPTRREILEMLRDRDLAAGEISERFDVSKPAISHHLNLLMQAGLVARERHGQHLVYAINTTVFQEAVGWMLDLADRKKGKKKWQTRASVAFETR